jgi:diaminopimelate decarboxylase
MRAHPAGPRHAEVLHAVGAGAPPADLSTIDAGVWASGVERGPSGELNVRGRDVTGLAAELGTPVFLLDEVDLRDRMRSWRDAFGDDAHVYYAAKAFLSKAVARMADDEGLHLDVCTGGELAVALAAGFPSSRIALHGNNKSVPELTAAVDAGVRLVVVDSLVEIERLAAVAGAAAVVQDVLVRVTVGVEAHTHEFIATAHEDVKFGFSLSGGAAAEAVRRIVAAPALRLAGLHSHIGSQIFDTEGFDVAAHRLVGLAAAVRDEHGIEVDELDLGGGLGIAYVPGDTPLPVKEVAEQLRGIVERECAASGLRVPRLAVEPGRAIVGPSTFTLYEVGTVKPLDGIRTYVSVDGGMSDNIRTALYDADYTVTLANRVSDAEPVLCRVVGKHCESGDVVVKDAWLPGDVGPGDLLAVAATGAYCRSMASSYNHVGRPPVVAVGPDGATRVLVRRETVEDLLALDVG